MQHAWTQQINFDKVVKPAQKTKEPLNFKREVRGEPVKPKKNAQCWCSSIESFLFLKENGRSRCSSILKENGRSRYFSIVKENGNGPVQVFFYLKEPGRKTATNNIEELFSLLTFFSQLSVFFPQLSSALLFRAIYG
jgi:sarcosine oxidase delta subunit